MYTGKGNKGWNGGISFSYVWKIYDFGIVWAVCLFAVYLGDLKEVFLVV